MNFDSYMAERVEGQIQWFNTKAIQAQKSYKRIQYAEIICAAAIPVLSAYAAQHAFVAVIIAVLGAAISIMGSVCKLNHYHENWLEYRVTCERLQREKLLFELKAGPYAEEETMETRFIANIEDLLASENNQWNDTLEKAVTTQTV